MPESPADQGIRLNKVIADSGLCARRKADELILAGQVAVNGQVVRTLGIRVQPGRDQVTVAGKPLPTPEKLYLMLHKPPGYVTSRRAGKGQKTIYDLLPKEWHSADPAGRLDQESNGLLILSNDGDFIHEITHPSKHLAKVYEVTLEKALSPAEIDTLKQGVLLQPENKLARMQQITSVKDASRTYRMTLMTGYNRQIRRSAELVGNRVLSLKRLSMGPFQLGNLPVGQVRVLTETELNSLKQFRASASTKKEVKPRPK